MKKIIQVSAVLSLMFVCSVVYANAQSTKQFSVQIPFDFNIGREAFPAGEYSVKISRVSPEAVTFTISDREKNSSRTVIVPKKSDGGQDDLQLLFNRYNNRRFFSGVINKGTEFSLARSSAEKRAAELNTEIVDVSKIVGKS